MHHFDPEDLNFEWWMAAQDVYLNDVMLPQQPYTCQAGPVLGQQASSLVDMAAQGMTDARKESLPAFPQARRPGPQRPVFGRISVLPMATRCDTALRRQQLSTALACTGAYRGQGGGSRQQP